MNLLPNAHEDNFESDALVRQNTHLPYAVANAADEGAGISIQPRVLLRKYWLLLVILLLLGCAAGFTSVVFSSPAYKAHLLLEVQNANSAMPNSGGENSTALQEDIQTEVNILRSGVFLEKAANRMQEESAPFTPPTDDIFSKLRRRIHPAAQDPIQATRTGMALAEKTFGATPVTGTRLIELSCESTIPDIAAQYLNAMAEEFREETSRSRMDTARKTTEWLAGQIEETRQRVTEAEQKLRDFVASSGNIFAGPDATLDDTKLARLKLNLAALQQDRIAKQTRYELTLHNPPESVAEISGDGTLQGLAEQMTRLKQQRAALTTTYTAKYDKVRYIDAQLASLKKAYDTRVQNLLRRMKNDYEAALTDEKRVNAAYISQAQRVGGEAGKQAQYNSLKGDVETQRAMYQRLLVQESEADMSSSVPVSPINIVESASAPSQPYTPRPVLNISFGALLSLVMAGVVVFLRERMDRSIKTPSAARILFNVPELGVIPNLGANGNLPVSVSRPKSLALNDGESDGSAALHTWHNGPAFISESFRGTLASILRSQVMGKPQKMILITSPGPAEGKTTVVQNLGIALAETGRKVLAVDADFRRPHLHHKFNLPNDRGLIDMLCEDRPVSEYSHDELGTFTGLPGLSILPNRVSGHNVYKALHSPRFRTILENLMKHYDMVLVDTPPILSIADTRIIAPLTDAMILVLRCGVTSRDSALEAYQRIQEDGLSLLGTVLTDYQLGSDRRRQYYYEYGDSSGA